LNYKLLKFKVKYPFLNFLTFTYLRLIKVQIFVFKKNIFSQV